MYIIQMTKHLKHPASEKLFPKINSYLLRNTYILLIYQKLVKVTIDHPKFIQYSIFSNKHPGCLNILELLGAALIRGRS